jgi:hypothetical protein
MPRPCLVVMVRAPVMGAVKTRLGREIGAAAALRFYRTCTASLLRRLGSDPRWEVCLAVTPDGALGKSWWPQAIPRRGQGRGGLGRRMQRLLDAAGRAPVLVMGSDIPAVRPADVARCFALVRRHGVVLAPAMDGGYWLVGVSGVPRAVRPFANVRWSTAHALADTRRNLTRAPGLGPVHRDVDTSADFDAVRSLAARTVLRAR